MRRGKYHAIVPIIFEQKKGLCQLLGLAVASAVTAALLPWPLKILIDHALVGSEGLSSTVISPVLLVVVAAMSGFLLFAANSALSVGSSWLWSKVGQSMVVDLSMRLFNRLQRLSRLFHTKHPVADSLNRLTVDSWCVFSIAQSMLITPVQNILTISVISIIAWQLDPQLTLLSLALAPLLGLTTVIFGNRIRNHSRYMRETQSVVMTFVHQTLSVMPLVKAFSRERKNISHFREIAGEAVVAAKKNTLVDQYYELINGLILSIGLAIVLFIGSGRVLEGAITVGGLLVFVGYLATLQGEAQSLLMTFKNLKTAEASLGRVMEIFDASESTIDDEQSRVLPRSTRARALDITFDDVSFGYTENQPILKNISFQIKAGQTVALVGGSGGGKSTLASLIPRFFDVTDGEIRIGDKPIRDIAIRSLRDRISFVLQDPYLMPLTIAENIAYGKPDATRAEIIQAATTANASAFIRKLPGGYETELGERGVNLSGGQKQRLSIARALLKDAPILILDEPTSALDTRTESLFFSAMEKLMDGRTSIIIAHRLSTIRSSDLIVVLQQGCIVEKGTHDELLELNGSYAQMHRIQDAANDENSHDTTHNTNVEKQTNSRNDSQSDDPTGKAA